ncbi:MAG: hypothetical protein WC852_04200 [Candidatus Nanoarchaeia archaeon]|jgi:hypothetical protein
MAKKSKSFNKHVYSLIAVVVLLVAAGIASYAVAPPGVATHGILYTDTIEPKTGDTIALSTNVDTKLLGDMTAVGNAGPLVRMVNDFDNENNYGELASTKYGVKGYTESDTLGAAGVYGETGIASSSGVEGKNTLNSNIGKLGTNAAGVEGTADDAAQFGVYGKQSAGGFAIKGENTDSGNYGELGGFTDGIKGYSNSMYGVSGSTGVLGNSGVYGFTANSNGYGGTFTGGKGLFASKIQFGTDAFSSANGYLVLASSSAICNNICQTHLLSCSDAYQLNGNRVGGTTAALACSGGAGSYKYCWCD